MPGVSQKPVYPAIVACMNETRLPRRGEIEIVAARIWAETHPAEAREWDAPGAASTARYRTLRAALAALGVQGDAMAEIVRQTCEPR